MQYNPKKIEKKWQKNWKEEKVYEPDLKNAQKPFYNLMMFPYPSAEGMHVGNMYAFVHSDAYGRFMRLQGYDVFEPIGLDGFGIHSENYAIKIGEHIKSVSKRTEKNYYKQLHKIGNAYDWSHTVETYKPDYYKWTQWLFLKMYEKGLAYRKKSKVNWCPSCKTVLSDEQIIGGKCERCDTITEKKEMEQWFWKITDYAEKLLKNLERLPGQPSGIDWTEEVKTIQKNWIGRSEGGEIEFEIKGMDEKIKVFTTRPDTLYGATYMVLAPEHELLSSESFKIDNKKEVDAYIKKAKKKSDLERTDLNKNKTGVKLEGVKAINPATKEEIPIFVADYVLTGYGTGAIMAVPAHDERDFEFARKYNLEIKEVILPKISKFLVIEKSLENCEENLKKFGEVKTTSRDKDWGNFYEVFVSSQKEEEFINYLKNNLLPEEKANAASFYSDSCGTSNYVIFKDNVFKILTRQDLEDFKKYGRSVGIPEEQLDIKPSVFVGEGELINSGEFNGLSSKEAIKKITKKFGKKKTQFKLQDWCISRQRYWGPPIPMVYCGECGWVPVPESELPVKLPGVEDFLPDGSGKGPLNKVEKFVNTKCPKCKGPAKRETDVSDPFVDSSWYYLRYPCTDFDEKALDETRLKKWMPVDMYIGGKEHSVLHLLYSRFVSMVMYELGYLPEEEPFKKFRAHGLLIKEGSKMSKSKGNVINPDEYIEKYGADAVRLYLMFLGDMRQGGDWRDSGMNGMYKFANRIYNTLDLVKEKGDFKELEKLLHKTIKGVGEDMENLKYNTAISKLMILINKIYEDGCDKKTLSYFAILLAPFAPHLAEELWSSLGNKGNAVKQKWPKYNEKLIEEKKVTIPVQINGKVRTEIEIEKNASEDEVFNMVPNEIIEKWIGEKSIKKKIYVPGKILNIIV